MKRVLPIATLSQALKTVFVGAAWLAALAILAPPASADLIIDDFENQAVGTGDGTPLHYRSFGEQLSDRGVSTMFGATSGTKAAFYVINFNEIGFGLGAARQELSLSLDPNQSIAVQVRIERNPVPGNFIGFRVTDTDGTVWRTQDNDLFAATTSFQQITQSLASITFQDEPGTTPGLNFANINSVGLLFYDRGYTGNTTIVFDDLKITAVPEPSSAILLASSIALVSLRFRASKRFREGGWQNRKNASESSI